MHVRHACMRMTYTQYQLTCILPKLLLCVRITVRVTTQLGVELKQTTHKCESLCVEGPTRVRTTVVATLRGIQHQVPRIASYTFRHDLHTSELVWPNSTRCALNCRSETGGGINILLLWPRCPRGRRKRRTDTGRVVPVISHKFLRPSESTKFLVHRVVKPVHLWFSMLPVQIDYIPVLKKTNNESV